MPDFLFDHPHLAISGQYMQKKNPLYNELKEETVWSMERFNAYVNEQYSEAKSLPQDWVLSAFTKRMQLIMTQCFLAVKAKLERKLGLFDLIGCDFMIDDDFKVWLLEMNSNPALHTNCQVLKEVVPSTVYETLDLTLEIFNKCRSGQKLLPLASQKNFILLYRGDCVQEQQNRATRLYMMQRQKTSTTTPTAQKAAKEAESRSSQPAPAARAPPPHPLKATENRRPLAVKIPKPRGTWLPIPKSVQLDPAGTWESPSDPLWLHLTAAQTRGRGYVLSRSTPGPGGESHDSVLCRRGKSASVLKERGFSSCLRYTKLYTGQEEPSI
ncbi:hypothetical protein GJAV_G00188840 [Gymnothorax javanicus]|nr:hypothetical protein GJAV_G00188840 [Gymnothorax javanicus]